MISTPRTRSTSLALALIVTALSPLGVARAAGAATTTSTSTSTSTSTASATSTTAPTTAVSAATITPPTRGERVGYEVAGGAVGLTASLALGYVVAQSSAQRCKGEDFCGLGAVALGGAVGVGVMTLAVPLGITIAGDRSGGRGRYMGSLGGGLLGAGAGIGLIYAVASTANVSDGAVYASVGVAFALHVAGAIAGYELSADDEPAPTSLVVAPVFAPTTGGGVLGVAAAF